MAYANKESDQYLNKQLSCMSGLHCNLSWFDMYHYIFSRLTPDFSSLIQSTPVISRLLGAKICERELSGSSVISRFRVKATTRDLQGHRPTYMTYSGVNSMLSDNKSTYVSRISTHIDITPATNHNKQH